MQPLCNSHASSLFLAESTTKSKLAKLNEKLTSLERQLEFLEAQASSVNAAERDD